MDYAVSKAKKNLKSGTNTVKYNQINVLLNVYNRKLQTIKSLVAYMH